MTSHRHRLFHLLLGLTHDWKGDAKLNLNILHDTLCFRIAKRRNEPFVGHGMKEFKPRYTEAEVYNEFHELMQEWENRA